MSSFGDIRPAILAMRVRVNLKQLQIIGSSNEALFIIVQQICQCLQRLGCSVWPRLAAPPATGSLENKLRIVPLDCSGSEIREEIISVHQKFPGAFISGIRQLELPGHETGLLATV